MQPLLQTILILTNTGKGIDADSSDSAGDILNLLTTVVTTVKPTDANQTSHLTLCLNVLGRIRSLVPEATKLTEQIVRDLYAKIEELLPLDSQIF